MYFVFGSPNLKFDENYLKTTVKMLSMQLFCYIFKVILFLLQLIVLLRLLQKKKKRKKKNKGSCDKVSHFKAHYCWHCPFWHIVMH